MITARVRSDLLKDVVDLEDEESGIIITLEVPRYNAEKARGLTDEQIFNEISLAHDTPTLKELSDEYLPPEKLRRFADSGARVNRRYVHAAR